VTPDSVQIRFDIPVEDTNTLYTIGYEGLTSNALIEKLRESRIEVLCDVRLHPVSRVYGFSKTALATALESSGITYLHLPALGNPKENRPGYAKQSTRGTSQEVFRTILRTSPASIAAMAELTKTALSQRTALLCYEGSPAYCHRFDVAHAVTTLAPELTTIHLR
jgi:uncharacterized protein (DUF488 family)